MIEIIGYMMILIPVFIVIILASLYEIRQTGIRAFAKYIITLLFVFIWTSIALYFIGYWR